MSIKKSLEVHNKALIKEVDKEVTKTMLLLDAPKESTYEIREAFGWNETEKKAATNLSKLVETATFLNKEKGENIILEEDLNLILIKNNYKLIKLLHYKGKITNDLLKIIENHFKSSDSQIKSDYNRDKLYIASPLMDDYNEKAKNSDELILFLDLRDGRFNNEQGYKMIGRCGKPTPIWNFIKACFHTHTRQENAIRNTLGFSLGLIVLYIMSRLFFYVDNEPNSVIEYLVFCESFLKICLKIFTAILFFKFFVIPIQFSFHEGDISFNRYDDEGYKHLKNSGNYKFSSCELKTYNYEKPVLKGKILEAVKFYNRMGKFVLLFVPLIIFFSIQILPLALYLNIKDVSIDTEHKTYVSTSPFTYKIVNK